MIGSGFKKSAQEHGMQVAHGVAYGNFCGFAAAMCEGANVNRIVLTARFTSQE